MAATPALSTSVKAKTPLTGNQKRGFLAAWGGWALDGMDSFIYALVLVPAMRELLPNSGIEPTNANVGFYGSILFAMFLVGWGLALIWGPIADRFGRMKTLLLTVLCFSLFTFLSAFATNIWALGMFRLLAGLGIGGEWSVGATFISEEWPEDRRIMGAGLMHTGYYFGFFLAAIANYFIGANYGWRAMFIVGGLPALVIAFFYNRVQEPEIELLLGVSELLAHLVDQVADDADVVLPDPDHRVEDADGRLREQLPLLEEAQVVAVGVEDH